MLENHVAVCQFTVGEKKIIGVCVNIYGIYMLAVVVSSSILICMYLKVTNKSVRAGDTLY